MKEIITTSLKDAVKAVQLLQIESSIAFIQASAELIAECYHRGNKIILAGNGGSLCDAAHFAEELTGQFRSKRAALPAVVLNDPGHITCVGNDYGFDQIFSRGVEAHGNQGDIFVGLTTSGNSPNIIRAFETAKALQMKTIAFLGKDGGALKDKTDLQLIINGFAHSDRIQEAHMAAIHIIIETVEHLLFHNNTNLLKKMVTCSETGNAHSTV